MKTFIILIGVAIGLLAIRSISFAQLNDTAINKTKVAHPSDKKFRIGIAVGAKIWEHHEGIKNFNSTSPGYDLGLFAETTITKKLIVRAGVNLGYITGKGNIFSLESDGTDQIPGNSDQKYYRYHKSFLASESEQYYISFPIQLILLEASPFNTDGIKLNYKN